MKKCLKIKRKYGIIDGREIEDGVYLVSRMVEKPEPFQLDGSDSNALPKDSGYISI
ncbi:hypothetical protein KFV02_11045 [Desulfohalobiaceae bacterium Ax17]|uniref:hypothetical protein n=1 Tax=Desulfovulcanus ferrireducens TaxID=2831190 RepID=UPI00207BBB06|nr:hypothetical protein [Desulfovulcanus ferrireducens]MBT8764470.1 hypothetical protein [Desulfovulcanus ferrireducens]